MKFLTNTLYVLFIAALVAVVGVFLATLIPVAGGVEVKIVKSGSMAPAIPTGSLIVVAPASVYQVGDVITFGEDTKSKVPTTHRVVNIEGDTFLTKGDANEEADPNPVARNEIIGKVWAHVPYAGFVLDFARQPIGFALLIGVPALIIILDELVNIFLEVKKLRRKKVAPLKIRFQDIKLVHRTVAFPKHNSGMGGMAMFLGAAVLSSSVFMGSIGGTFSYLRDIEVSQNNMLGAGTWNEIVTQVQFSILEISIAPPSGDVMGSTTEATTTEPVVELSEPEVVIEEPPQEDLVVEEEPVVEETPLPTEEEEPHNETPTEILQG